MKIANGDKITIKNIGKIAVDIPTFKHNFSYRLSGGESLVFPITSVEQALFYLKQKIVGLDVSIGDEPAPTASKLQVNKTYSSITIDPTKITEGDMKGFLARVCGDEAEMNLVPPGYFLIQNVKDGSTVPNNAYMFVAFAEKGPYYLSLYGQTMSGGGPKPISTDGWYMLENEDWVPLTESITITVPSEMPAIESINDDFNTTLNGTVITGVES